MVDMGKNCGKMNKMPQKMGKGKRRQSAGKGKWRKCWKMDKTRKEESKEVKNQGK